MGSQIEAFDCVVVGAGISGLLAATVLGRSGMSVCVVDKGRGLGGRMATRRHEGAVFDHGAQFFTVRDARFAPWVAGWEAGGLVAPWYELPGSGIHYRGVPGMTAIAKHLAAGLDVRREVEVDHVTYQRGTWSVETLGGLAVQAPALVLTAPVPQSLALLAKGGVALPEPARRELESIRFHRCIAALAVLDGPSALTRHGGAMKIPGEPVQWIADNQRKGISPSVPSATIHSTPAFAEEHWDSPDDVRLPLLLDAAAPFLEVSILSCHSRRWGFSQPASAFSEEAYVDRGRRLAIAGDGLAGGRVEGAAVSGLAAAAQLSQL